MRFVVFHLRESAVKFLKTYQEDALRYAPSRSLVCVNQRLESPNALRHALCALLSPGLRKSAVNKI